MALVVADFFNIIGVDMTPPATMSELIPYILVVVVGLCLVCAIFRVIGKIVEGMLFFRR